MSNFPSGEDYTNVSNALLETGRQAEDMAMMIRKLARALTKASPKSELPARAMDFLKRIGREGSPLRGNRHG